MSSALTETETFVASVSAPDDGDPRNAASVRAPLADLANRTLYLKQFGPTLTGTRRIQLVARSVTKVAGPAFMADPTNWKVDAAVDAYAAKNLVVGTDLLWPFAPPNGSTITGVATTYKGAAGHGGLPAVMPTVALVTLPIATGVPSASATGTDASAAVVNFEAIHTISKTGLSVVVDTTLNRYFVKLNSESGANSAVAARSWGASFTATVSEMDDGQ